MTWSSSSAGSLQGAPTGYRPFRGGVAYEYQPALLHAKTMVIDGVWTTIGSTNLDNQSFARSDEINLVVYGTAVARRMERVFLDDIANAQRVTYETWRDRGIWNRVQELLVLPIRNWL